MKRFLWLLFLPMISSYAQQSDSMEWNKSLLLTEDWPDAVSPMLPFQFSARIILDYRKQRVGKTRHQHYYAAAKWIRNTSFMADSVEKTYRPLAQMYFDIYELESRKVQKTVNIENTNLGLIVADAEMRANNFIGYIRSVTKEGKDSFEMQKMQHWIDSALSATLRFFIPNWEEGNFKNSFGLSYDLGVGMAILNKDFAQFFNPIIGFSYGVDFHIRRVCFDFRTIIGFTTHSKQDFLLEDFKFYDTNNIGINQSTISLGYRLFPNKKWVITPYVGLGSFRVINRDEPKGSLFRNGPGSVNIEGGLLTTWRFFPFSQDNSLLCSWVMIFKAGYANMNYVHKLEGGLLKFQVGIGFTFNTIRNIPFDED